MVTAYSLPIGSEVVSPSGSHDSCDGQVYALQVATRSAPSSLSELLRATSLTVSRG